MTYKIGVDGGGTKGKRARRVLSVAVHNHYKRLRHSGKAGDVGSVFHTSMLVEVSRAVKPV